MKKKNRIKITAKEIREMQLNALKQFAYFCDEHNLQYALCGGTLLGAVRHNGFIPWDDDIDVFVPRVTYNYLCKNFNRWAKRIHLKLINYFNNGYYSTFAKIIDTRTIAQEEKRNEKIGIWIDLFIVDSMLSNLEDFSKPIMNALKEIRFFGSDNYFKNNSVIKKYFTRLLLKPFFRNKIEKFIKKNSGTYHVAYSFADQICWWKKMGNIDFDNPVLLLFEGYTFKAPGNWKNYLINRYGANYMELPPEKERTTHSLNNCFWK